MKKSFICILLTLCMLAALSGAAFADGSDAGAAALSLHHLGLFRGVGDNADGTPNFDLSRTPNRAEAVTMLVRLLGKEEEALSGTWETPFTDVPDWAKPYVGYAYGNGLTNGTGATTFSSDALVSAAQYLTFVLRALGYSSETDFKWDEAWEMTDALGITNGEYGVENNTVTRGDMAVISADTMGVTLKDQDTTLIEKLVEDGAVASEAAAAEGFVPAVQAPETPEEAGITVARGDDGLVIAVTNQAGLTAALAQTEPVAEINITESFSVTEDSGVSYEGEKLEFYANVTVTVEEGVTLTVAEGGAIGVYWFTYDGDWETGTLPNGSFFNDGTLIVEKDGWVNGEFTENRGTVLVKDGGQCQTMPNQNTGTVTVESGGSYRTGQGQEAVNEGEVFIAEGANMVARFGSRIINAGTLEMNGLLSVGYVYFKPEGGEMGEHEELWFANSGTVTGFGTARVYDVFNENGESEYTERMLELMRAELGDDTTLTVTVGIGTGV